MKKHVLIEFEDLARGPIEELNEILSCIGECVIMTTQNIYLYQM